MPGPTPPQSRPGRPGALPGLFDINHFGAVGDGKTLCTGRLQAAIDACGAAGGGMVYVPPGRYLTGALFLRSNIHLHLDDGATLLASDHFDHFPPVAGRAEGVERRTYSSLLTGTDLENVSITGHGVLDGNGPAWWKADQVTRDLRNARNLPREADNPPDAPLRWPRPCVVNLTRCRRTLLKEVSIHDGPSWNVHFAYCQDVLIEGLTLVGLQAQHCDGIVIDSCRQVRIAHCSVGSGSESVSIKSGYNEDGRRVGIPSEDIVVTNCHLFNSLGAGVAVGSETSGGIRNVVVSNCTMSGTRFGVFIRSPRGRGAVVERIRVQNVVMDNIREAAVVVSHFPDSVPLDSLFAEGPPAKKPPAPDLDRSISLPPDVTTPAFRDLTFKGLTVGQVPTLAIIEGLPESYIQGVRIANVEAPFVKGGLSCTRAEGVVLSGVNLGALAQAGVVARDVRRLEIHRLRVSRPPPKAPVVHLDRVDGALVHGCEVADAGGRFVVEHGEHNRGLKVMDNNVPPPEGAGAGGLATPHARAR